MAKQIFFNDEAKQQLLKGIDDVSNAVGSTMGPGGKTVIISSAYGHYPVATKDGVTVASSTTVEDEIHNTGVMLIRGAAEKTVQQAGDGTTASVVLAQSMIRSGLEYVKNGANAGDVRSGMEKAVDAISRELARMAISPEKDGMLKGVATISANNDSAVGDLIVDAYEKMGGNGMLDVVSSNSPQTHTRIVEGMEMIRGYVNDKFVTNVERMEAVYEKPLIFVFDYEIKTFKEIEPLIQNLVETNGYDLTQKPFVLIARGFEGEPHNTILVNKLQNRVKVCLVAAPAAYQKEALLDIATVTGATIISDEAGRKPEHAILSDHGTCEKIVIGKFNTVVVGGVGNKDAVEEIKRQIDLQVEETSNEQLKDILLKRKARLTGSVGVIHVGGATDIEMKERKDRVDDAVKAVKAAYEEGVVPGGGIALIRATSVLRDLNVSGDELYGVGVIEEACLAPLKKMLSNAGLDAGILKQVQEATGYVGYNIKKRKMQDMVANFVVDPAKVVRCSLQNAASVAAQIITSDVLLVEMRPTSVQIN